MWGCGGRQACVGEGRSQVREGKEILRRGGRYKTDRQCGGEMQDPEHPVRLTHAPLLLIT